MNGIASSADRDGWADAAGAIRCGNPSIVGTLRHGLNVASHELAASNDVSEEVHRTNETQGKRRRMAHIVQPEKNKRGEGRTG